jgi:DNA-binding beta-propeller fold protein YncE
MLLIKYLKYFFLLYGLFQLIACSKKQLPQTQEVVVYPSPPDTARIQFLTKFSTSYEVEGQRSAFGKFLVGQEPPKPIIKPYGVAMHKGEIFLCDLDLGGLEILNMKENSFEYFIPKGLGQLKLPINCFIDSLGYLYVADATRKQVVIFDQNRQYVTGINTKGKFKPTDVFVTQGKIWVANVINGTIDVFQNDSTYQYLYSIPESKEAPGKIYQPTNLFVTADRVYVSDFGEFNIKLYDHEGNYIEKIGSYGKALGQFARPKGIAVDKQGIMYVVDAAFENVQMFDKEGNLLMFFGGSYEGPGDMWLPAKIAISYDDNEYFQKYVNDRYTLKYIILVTNNFGPDKVNVYGYIEEKRTTTANK